MAEIELENSELPYVILRPRALAGRGDTVIMPRLIRAFEEGKLKIKEMGAALHGIKLYETDSNYVEYFGE